MAVGVSHQLVGFFSGGVKAEGMVDVVVDTKGHGSIGAVYRAG